MKNSIKAEGSDCRFDIRPISKGKSSPGEVFSMSDDDLLSSWKEIAAYLGCDIKTCARWEKESALPVRRITPGSKRSRVFAYKTDLDRWLTDRNIEKTPGAAASARNIKRRSPTFAVAAAVLLIGTPAVWFVGHKIFSPAAPPVVAVRAIHHAAVSPSDHYLAEQLTDQVIRSLEFGGLIRVVKIPEAAAIPGVGSFPKAGSPKSDYSLEATLRAVGTKFSLAVDFVDDRTGRAIFSDTRTAPAAEFGLVLSGVCEEIRRRVAPHGIEPKASEENSPKGEALLNFMKGKHLLDFVSGQSTDPLSLYYEGLYYANLGEGEANEMALPIFKKALDLDPTFAPAYLGLAQCYANYVMYENRFESKWLDKAEELLAQAQARYSDLAEYFTLRIKVLYLRELVFGGDRSREYFALAQKGLELYPYNGRLAQAVGHCFFRRYERRGDESDLKKALHYYEIFCSSDPASISNLNYAEILMLRREFGRALQVSSAVLGGAPSARVAFACGAILYYQGDLAGSLAAFQLCTSPPANKISALYYEGMIAARRRDREKAFEILRQIQILETKKDPIIMGHLRTASIYAGLGEIDKATDLLREGYEALREQGTFVMKKYIELDPNFESIRDRLDGPRTVARISSSIGGR
jgi:tetratricopeptide (TPR) repeat protein